MNFILAERYGVKYLIVENTYPRECWTLTLFTYSWSFDEYQPSLVSMNGMTLKVISEKEGLEMLEEHADGSVKGSKVKKFLEQYKACPF